LSNLKLGGYKLEYICLDFINSQWHKKFNNVEVLKEEHWINEFLIKWNFHSVKLPNSSFYPDLLSLRNTLVNTLETILLNETVDLIVLKDLNKYLSLCTYRKSIEKSDNILSIIENPESYDWNWVMSEIALSFCNLVLTNNLSKIKTCENPDCEFIYYDNSKNQTKRWCCNNCSNLMKVRRFRSKQKNLNKE
jgi:predicted RNA-binding Zn ribbon-like protein